MMIDGLFFFLSSQFPPKHPLSLSNCLHMQAEVVPQAVFFFDSFRLPVPSLEPKQKPPRFSWLLIFAPPTSLLSPKGRTLGPLHLLADQHTILGSFSEFPRVPPPQFFFAHLFSISPLKFVKTSLFTCRLFSIGSSPLVPSARQNLNLPLRGGSFPTRVVATNLCVKM